MEEEEGEGFLNTCYSSWHRTYHCNCIYIPVPLVFPLNVSRACICLFPPSSARRGDQPSPDGVTHTSAIFYLEAEGSSASLDSLTPFVFLLWFAKNGARYTAQYQGFPKFPTFGTTFPLCVCWGAVGPPPRTQLVLTRPRVRHSWGLSEKVFLKGQNAQQ